MTYLRTNSVPRTDYERRVWNQSYSDLALLSNDVLLRLYLRHAGQRWPLSGRLARAIKRELGARADERLENLPPIVAPECGVSHSEQQ